MAFQTKHQLRSKISELQNELSEKKTKISEMQARIDIYEMAINNAGLSALKEKHPKVKEEFGFVCKKKGK